jgi:hypothetical protein
VVPTDNGAVREKYHAAADQPLLVLADLDGTEVLRATATDGKLDVHAIEKGVRGELDKREDAAGDALKAAEKQASAGDKDGAIAAYQKIFAARCLFPSFGKKAAKALKKLGVAVESAALERLGPDGLADPAVEGADPSGGRGARVAQALREGLDAELQARYSEAERLYRRASELDPADTTALRFLGELYRHQTGEWDKARAVFHRVLAQPADPIARAVALHGLGKMTIHAGRFADGLAMFERSLAEYRSPSPIATSRFTGSRAPIREGGGVHAPGAGSRPEDRYNQIFSAVYLAAAGHRTRPWRSPRPTTTCSRRATTWRRSTLRRAIAPRPWSSCAGTSTSTSASTRCARWR